MINKLHRAANCIFKSSLESGPIDTPKIFEIMEEDDISRLRLSICHAIRRTREEAGLSRLEVAQRSGLTERRIENIEDGREAVGVELLSRVAEALDSKIIDLLIESRKYKN